MRTTLGLLSFVIATASLARPIHFDSGGEAGLVTHQFSPDQDDHTLDQGHGGFAKLEIKGYKGRYRLRIKGIVAKVPPLKEYDRAYFEQAYLSYQKHSSKFLVGAQVLNWTTTEAFHPADLVNARVLSAELDRPERFGEPMAYYQWSSGDIAFETFFMPTKVASLIPDGTSRISPLPSGTPLLAPLFIGADGKPHQTSFAPQWGGSTRVTFRNVDLRAFYLNHFDRTQPAFYPSATGVTPVYFKAQSFGFTAQGVLEPVVYKIEWAYRSFGTKESPDLPGLSPHPAHSSLALGFDYPLSSEMDHDLTLLLEGSHMTGLSQEQKSALNPFEHDLLLGIRYQSHTENAPQAVLVLVKDYQESDQWALRADLSRNFGDQWRGQIQWKVIDAPPPSQQLATGLQAFHKANQLILQLTRYF